MIQGRYLTHLLRAVKHADGLTKCQFKNWRPYTNFRKDVGKMYSPYDINQLMGHLNDENTIEFDYPSWRHITVRCLGMQTHITSWDDFLAMSEFGAKYGLCWDNQIPINMSHETLYKYFMRHNCSIYIAIDYSHHISYYREHYWRGEYMYSLKKFMKRYERYVKLMDRHCKKLIHLRYTPDEVKPNVFRRIKRRLILFFQRKFTNKS